MSMKILISCDGNGCGEDYESFSPDFDVDEIIELGWHDSENDFHYCPSCVQKMIKSGELELTPVQAGCGVVPDGYGGGYECNCGKCV